MATASLMVVPFGERVARLGRCAPRFTVDDGPVESRADKFGDFEPMVDDTDNDGSLAGGISLTSSLNGLHSGFGLLDEAVVVA